MGSGPRAIVSPPKFSCFSASITRVLSRSGGSSGRKRTQLRREYSRSRKDGPRPIDWSVTSIEANTVASAISASARRDAAKLDAALPGDAAAGKEDHGVLRETDVAGGDQLHQVGKVARAHGAELRGTILLGALDDLVSRATSSTEP